MAQPATIELPTGYYLDNFTLVGEWVNRHYPDLLTPDETRFWQSFQSCSIAAQRLFVRLSLRRGPYFRSDRIQYAEIPDVAAAAQELARGGLLAINPDIDIQALAALLRKEELPPLFASLSLANRRKQDAVGALIDCFGEQLCPPREFAALPFDLWQPLGQAVIRVWRLLFFGNLRQDFTEFVLLDLGMYRYEDYPIDFEQRLFDSRERIDGYLQLQDWAEGFEESQRDPDWVLPLARTLLTLEVPEALRHRFARLVNRVARQLERFKAYELALDLYRRTPHWPPSRERQTRLLHQAGDLDGAEALLAAIAAAPLDEEERTFVQRFSPKLRRARGEKVPRQTKSQPASIDLQLPPGEQRVELATAEHLTTLGWQVHYVENSLMQALFGLAFWSEIFLPVPRVFFNRYQRGPRDLFTPAFAQARQTALAQRWQSLEGLDGQALADLLVERYRIKQGINTYLVNWLAVDDALIRQACEQIPPAHLHAIWRRMLFDLGANRSGFPDLIAFRPETGQYSWFEVKGPGDNLQDNQRRWLAFFDQQAIPYQVAWITWQDTST